jgi:DNA-binding LacI/PurR family transcriptional regulator
MRVRGPRSPKRPSPPPQRTSLKEIARITGYSITTVSMVLNGRSAAFSISDDTRDLVLAAAREHNYQPNLHARRLRSRTSDIVGLMVPTLYNGFFSEMAETFETLARAAKKFALITVTRYDRQEELNAVNYFLSQNVDCIFTANPMALEEVSGLCERAGTKHIILDAPESDRPTVTTDNADASRVLTRMLLSSLAEAGRTGRVYYVGGMADHEVTRLRLAGFRAALKERGIRFTDDLFVPTAFDAASACEEIRGLFGTRDDIAGMFLNSLLPLDGLVRYFAEAPARCRPVHYGVFDYHPMMSLLLDLHLLAVRQDPDRMMRVAFEIFSRGLEGERGKVHFVPYEIFAPSARPARLRAGVPAVAVRPPAPRGATMPSPPRIATPARAARRPDGPRPQRPRRA